MGIWRGLVAICLFIGSADTFALTYKEAYCAKTNQQFLNQAVKPENRLSFRNPNGFLDLGLCWWHSRFERSANYLAIFIPTLPKPTEDEAQVLINKIILRNQVLVIPGFKNLREFSEAYRGSIETALSRWQLRDGFLNQFWTISLKGKIQISADDLENKMKDIYQKFRSTQKLISIILKSYDAVHMWLITDIKPVQGGYDLKITDSNKISNFKIVPYRFGDEKLIDPASHQSQYVPELALNSIDLNKIDAAMAAFCAE